MSVEVRRDGVVVALENLICVIRLISHRIDLAEGHVPDWVTQIVSTHRRRRICHASAKRTDPCALTCLLGEIQLMREPCEDSVRVPDGLVRVVEPNCGGTRKVSGSFSKAHDRQRTVLLVPVEATCSQHFISFKKGGVHTSSSC